MLRASDCVKSNFMKFRFNSACSILTVLNFHFYCNRQLDITADFQRTNACTTTNDQRTSTNQRRNIMAAVFGMWATIAIMVVVGVDATAFVVSSSSRSASTNTQLASEYASTRARTQNDYNIDINRELGGPMVSYNGPNTRPVSNIRAPSLGEIWDSTMPVTVQWISADLALCQSRCGCCTSLVKIGRTSNRCRCRFVEWSR